MTTYTLLLFPAAAAVQVTVIPGYETSTEASDAGTAALADAYFARKLVIPGPVLVQSGPNIYQPSGGSGFGGGGGGQQN